MSRNDIAAMASHLVEPATWLHSRHLGCKGSLDMAEALVRKAVSEGFIAAYKEIDAVVDALAEKAEKKKEKMEAKAAAEAAELEAKQASQEADFDDAFSNPVSESFENEAPEEERKGKKK